MSESGKGKLTFGLVLLLTGVILFLQLEGERNTGFGTLWPLYLILFGGIGLFGRGGKTFSGILLLAGVFFLLRNLNVLPYISGAYVWPALIILIGLAVIGSAFSRRKGGATTGGEGRYSAIFGEAADVINDPDFKSLSVNACFGSAQLDLSRADMRAEQAEIDVFAAFGGVEIMAGREPRPVHTGRGGQQGAPGRAGAEKGRADRHRHLRRHHDKAAIRESSAHTPAMFDKCQNLRYSIASIYFRRQGNEHG